MENFGSYILIQDCMFHNSCPKYLKWGETACAQEGNNYCTRLFKLNSFYNKSLLTLPQRKEVILYANQNDVPSDYDKFIELSSYEKDIVKFVMEGKSLFIHSLICGNGKTSWAIKLMRSYFNNVWKKAPIDSCPGLFVSLPKYFLDLKSSFNVDSEYINHINENILKADLVIWDEVGTKDLTDFEREKLLSIINVRIDSGKANIYTSNVPVKDIETRIGSRLFSRMINNSIDVTFNSTDKRGKNYND